MNRYYYDFHIHSCLSPCGDNDMTPNNIAGMASLAGLQIVALTDHNSCKNCPAFFKAAKRYGIVPVAGMELTTAEDIHVVCLFEALENAMAFDSAVDAHRIKIKNRADIFGEQLILDENDNCIGKEEFLLLNATDISVDDVPAFIADFDGVCFPAHIDRQANGIIATLGTFPDIDGFSIAEIRDAKQTNPLLSEFPALQSRRIVYGSDAHYLQDIRDAANSFLLEDEPYSSALIRQNLFLKLKDRKERF